MFGTLVVEAISDPTNSFPVRSLPLPELYCATKFARKLPSADALTKLFWLDLAAAVAMFSHSDLSTGLHGNSVATPVAVITELPTTVKF